MKTLERILEWGGIKKDITLLIISLIALLASLFEIRPFIFDLAWISVILCGVPIVLEAIIGLVTTFDIKADVLVSLALIASLLIGEDFAAGEVAFIMQLGALLEDLTVSRARAGIEKLILTVGRLFWEKNVISVIRKFDAFLSKYPQYRDYILYIAGDGVLREEYDRQIKEMGRERQIVLLGIINAKSYLTA